MSRNKWTVRRAALTAGVAACVVAIAPWTDAFQRPPPVKEAAWVEAAAGCLGHGKGELSLPVIGQDGRMSGSLLDCEAIRKFKLEAILTGCMPEGGVGDVGYTFGGLYGKVWELGTQPEGWLHLAPTYRLEGMWYVNEAGYGSFEAEALRVATAGRVKVVGKVYGRFRVVPGDPLGLRVVWGDALAPSKPAKGPFGEAAVIEPEPEPYGDAATAPRKGGKTPYGEARDKQIERHFGDAATAPRKGGKTPYGEAWEKPIEQHYGDAATAPRKGGKTPYGEARDKQIERHFGDAATAPRKGGKTRYRDAATDPNEWRAGYFYLRFRFFE